MQQFPYQIVTFLEREPSVGEQVYYGENGWYPQLALKRRFGLVGIDEEALVVLLEQFFRHTELQSIDTGELTRHERMPVHAIALKNQAQVWQLHQDILRELGDRVTSKYADREGVAYYPHVTAEYNGEFVIPVETFSHASFAFDNVWLLKDVDDDNSRAYRKLR